MKRAVIAVLISLIFTFSACGIEKPAGSQESPAVTQETSQPKQSSATSVAEEPIETKPTSPWSKGKDMPTARFSLRSAVVDGKIYAMGGSNKENLSVVEAYDPAMDSWSPKSDLPVSTECIGATAVNGKIYAFMMGETYQDNGTVYEYDPASDAWTQKAEMTSNRCNLGIIAYDQKIYVIGGLSTTDEEGYFDNVKTVEAFFPETGKWEAKADMPTARHALSVTEINGKIYAIAGSWTRSNGNDYPCKVVEEYDPASDTWTKKANFDFDTAYHCSVAVNDRIYLIGGVRPDYMYSYDAAKDKWTYVGQREPIWQNCMAVCNNKVYLAGGTYDGISDGSWEDEWTPTNILEVYDPALE